MINKKTAEQVLSRALATGGDFAEIFFEDTRKNTLGMIDGKIDTATTRRTHGAGIRIYKGLNAYTCIPTTPIRQGCFGQLNRRRMRWAAATRNTP